MSFAEPYRNPGRTGGGVPADPNLSRLSSVYSLMEPPVCCVQLHLYTVLIGSGGRGGVTTYVSLHRDIS